MKLEKIVFLYPNYQEKIGKKNRSEIPPLGMLSVCASLERLDTKIEVYQVDMETNPNDLPEADIYAYSITATVTYPIFKRLVPLVRKKAWLHVAGNTHVNIFPKQTLDELGVDVVFVGEGELSFKDWILSDCKLRGIVKGAQVNINEIPPPARHLLSDDKILLNQRLGGSADNIVVMWSSRGCIYNCSYCANLNNGSNRLLTTKNFQNELLEIKARYPQVQGVMILDEIFTFNSYHAIDMANVIADENLLWECTTRADFLKKEVVMELVKTKCVEVKLGLESGSQAILDKMNKRLDLAKAKRNIITAAELGLPIKLFLMHGYPGENWETTKETINLLHELRKHLKRVTLFRFTPLPGSPIYLSPSIIHKNFDEYTIYENNSRWWGSYEDYQEVNESFQRLQDTIIELFGKIN